MAAEVSMPLSLTRRRLKVPSPLLSAQSKESWDAASPAWRYLGGAAALRTTKPIHDGRRMRYMRRRLREPYTLTFMKRFSQSKKSGMAGEWETVGELEISVRAEDTINKVKSDQSANSMPTRIYDTRSGELRPPLRFEKYIAVSYVWTQYSSVGDIVEDMRHIIEATQINSLWIDRVCINQEDAQDKAREVPRMDEYYSGANLVVALLPDVDVAPGLMSLIQGTVVKTAGNALLRLYALLRSSKWIHRVWTFQEAALARRLLLVTETATIDDAEYSLFSEVEQHIESGKCEAADIEWSPWRRHEPVYCDGYDCGAGAILAPASKLRLPGSRWDLAELPELWSKAGPRGCFHAEDQVYGYLGLLNLPRNVPVVYGIGFENLMQGIFRCIKEISTKILISSPSRFKGCCWLPSISDESRILRVGDSQRKVEVPWARITSTGTMRIRATRGRVEVETGLGRRFVNYCSIGKKHGAEWDFDGRRILISNCRTDAPDDLYEYDALFVRCKYENKGATMIIWGKAKRKGTFHRIGACVVSGTVQHADKTWKLGDGVPKSK